MLKPSPYSQYYIRQLLRKSANQVGYPLSGVGIHRYFQADITQVLQQVCSSPVELSAKISELERLTNLHQKGTEQFSLHPKDLSKIEQKILWLLGLEFLAMLPALELQVVPESSVAMFTFFLNDRFQQGIRAANGLHGKAFEFGAEYNSQACRFLFSLNGQQIPFLLTVSEQRHGVWVNLRSPAYLTLHQFDSLTREAS